MDQNALWGITLSLLVLRWWWKNHHLDKKPKVPKQQPPVFRNAGVTQEALRAKEAAAKQRARDEEELRKQGYTDELIATILPVINND